MSTVADPSGENLEQWIASKIASASQEARPISRLTLTRMVSSEFSLHSHQAEQLVDQYCDEKAPSVPTMLSNEFGVPYLKVLSVVNIALSVGFYLMAINVQNSIWIGLLLGTGFLGGAVFCWVRSLNAEGEQAGKKTSRA